MATFTHADDLQGSGVVDADLEGDRFVGTDLSGVVMRAVDVQGAGHRRTGLFDGESLEATSSA